MPRIFVNYRTNDEEACAVLVERELSNAFGTANVFRASKSIPLGAQFEDQLLRGVWRSDALVAVIGKRWLAATDARGNRALDNPADWTRREIVEAFSHGTVVIPLLVNGAKLLTRKDLPADLTDLAVAQYMRFDHRSPDFALTKLVERLRQLDGTAAAEPPAPEPAGQRGGIGSITADTVNAVTDAQAPVNMGSGQQLIQSDFSADGATFVPGGRVGTIGHSFSSGHKKKS